MKLFNTLTSEKEELKPIEDKKIRMYTCGPTVYDVAHIGNLRKYLCDDLLEKSLVFCGFGVNRVMNITDVDDKTIRKSEGKKREFDELTKRYEDSFISDLKELNISVPKLTRATEYIDRMVKFVEELLQKGFAYKTSDGSVYFSIAKFQDYGKLSKLENREIKVGARVNQDEYDKENPSDFALWKAWDENDGEIFWDPSTWLGTGTSLGKGRPGWHIECSAMSMDTLGDQIDIHTGGVDNIFPHHENEIAQSEAKSGKKFVSIWVHNEHLLVDGHKMSKSAGNFYTLAEIKERGFSPLDFRYLIIGAHYRSKINFTWEGLGAAKNSRERMKRILAELPSEGGKVDQVYEDKFRAAISDDVNIPQALSIAWELLRDETIEKNVKWATMLEFDAVLGLKIAETYKIEIPTEIKDLAEARAAARENKDWAKTDELRDKIKESGWTIEDLPDNKYRLKKV